MYKFPVIKDQKEYAVYIYQDPYYVAGFKVKLYIKKKLFFITYDSCIEDAFYSYTKDDDDYLKMLQSNSLFQTFAKWVINKYEKNTYKENLLLANEESFENWNGII